VTRRGLLASIVAIATFVALAGGGAAAAAWIASATAPATASSVTVATTLTQAGSLATTYRYSGSTSPAASGTLVIANTGRAPLTYALATQVTGSASLAQKTALQLWAGACTATPPATGTTTTTLADPAPALPDAARSLAPGATVTVCVATRISGTDATASNAALQGQSVTATFRVTGTVGSSWTAGASASPLTQSVFRVAPAGAVSCAENWLTRGVTLTWGAPANRVAGSPVVYRVFDTATGVDVAKVTADAPSASVAIDPYALPRNGTYALGVEARDSFSGTTAATAAPITLGRTGLLLPTLHCP
jgi:hypothetical protein